MGRKNENGKNKIHWPYHLSLHNNIEEIIITFSVDKVWDMWKCLRLLMSQGWDSPEVVKLFP